MVTRTSRQLGRLHPLTASMCLCGAIVTQGTTFAQRVAAPHGTRDLRGRFVSSMSRFRFGATLVLAFAVAFTVTKRQVEASRTTSSRSGDHQPPSAWHGRQLVIVLLGSTDCGFSTDPALHHAFAEIVRHSSVTARSRGERLRTLGVAIDQDRAAGLAFLETVWAFDETIAGGGWTNSGAVRYAVRDLAGPLGVPQVIVTSHRLALGGDSLVAVGPDSVHRRLVGRDAIVRWAARLASRGGAEG